MSLVNLFRMYWNCRPFSMKEIDRGKMWIHSDDGLSDCEELERYFRNYDSSKYPIIWPWSIGILSDRKLRHDLIVRHWDRRLDGNLPALTDKWEYRRQLFGEWFHQGRNIRDELLRLEGWCNARKNIPYNW